jgi:hypothetical protein
MSNSVFSRLVLVFISLLLISCDASEAAAQKDAPEAVKQTFARLYPNAKKVDWRTDRNDNYEAHFTQQGTKLRADFTPAGDWVETEQNVDWDELPQAVQAAIKKDYDKDDIVELEYTNSAAKGKFYDVELDPKGEKKFDVEYRSDGSRL